MALEHRVWCIRLETQINAILDAAKDGAAGLDSVADDPVDVTGFECVSRGVLHDSPGGGTPNDASVGAPRTLPGVGPIVGPEVIPIAMPGVGPGVVALELW